MAYIDFNLKTPDAPAGPAPEPVAPPERHARRIERPSAALWIALGIGGVVALLLFALAFVAIREPWMAAIVTTILLLPAAALFGGDGRRHP